MKYEVKFTTQFKKDLKLAQKQNKNLDKLFEIVDILATGAKLDLKPFTQQKTELDLKPFTQQKTPQHSAKAEILMPGTIRRRE